MAVLAYDWEDLQSGRRLACKEGPTPGREGCSPGRECPTPGMERHRPKGQLISKCLFGVIIWTKIATNML